MARLRSTRPLFDLSSTFNGESFAVRPLDNDALRNTFFLFLESNQFYLAQKNFEALLKEKSGKKFYRNDGTISWYHEFVPILMVLSLIQKGKKDGGLDLDDFEPYGGLEVAICTHLRHDSVEDHTKLETIDRQMRHMIQEIKSEKPDYDEVLALKKLSQIKTNIDLMSQKTKYDKDTNTWHKENIHTYTDRMVTSSDANPVVYLLKLCDGIHNLATLHGSPKFNDKARLLRYCDEREDMYGPRYGFTGIACRKWPRFRRALETLDSMMGTILYPHFRYLESVDLHYKVPSDSPVGIDRYLRRALSLHMPEAFNPIHIMMKRLISSVDPKNDPEKHMRLQRFVERVLRPSLQGFEKEFPYLQKYFQTDIAPPSPS
jgi:hypothetical protein